MRLLLIFAALLGCAAQTCPSGDEAFCAFDPTNPHQCGELGCYYDSICLAESAGFNIDKDCCQAPMPSMCSANYEPLVCGSKKCEYDNQCIASLAGYSEDQCSTPPPECPTGSGACTDNFDPYTCGINRCEYPNSCEAEAAGFNVQYDCCRDPNSSGAACDRSLKPVSCGWPGEPQCTYDNQCLADNAGYDQSQCCPSVPEGIACQSIFQPVQCRDAQCVYASQCEASAAGFSEQECCPQPVPSTCDTYAIGYDPVVCGSNGCVYNMPCLAENAGYNPDSCIPGAQAGAQSFGVDESASPSTSSESSEANAYGAVLGQTSTVMLLVGTGMAAIVL